MKRKRASGRSSSPPPRPEPATLSAGELCGGCGQGVWSPPWSHLNPFPGLLDEEIRLWDEAHAKLMEEMEPVWKLVDAELAKLNGIVCPQCHQLKKATQATPKKG